MDHQHSGRGREAARRSQTRKKSKRPPTELKPLLRDDPKPSDFVARLQSGTVKWFRAHLGYGFVTLSDESVLDTKDVFLHHTGIVGGGKTLESGLKVCFDIMKTDKGLKAVNLFVTD